MNKIILTMFVLLAICKPLYASNMPQTDENVAKKLERIIETINIAINLSAHDDENGYYSEKISNFHNNMEDIIQKAILPRLQNYNFKYNTLTFNSGERLNFYKINSTCDIRWHDEFNSKNNACATVDIDINSYNPPNKFLKNIDNPQDKYTFLLFADGIVPENNSLEEQFLKLSNLNGIKIYDSKLFMYADLYNNNDSKQKYALEVRFFNSKNEQLYSKVFSGEIEANRHYDFSTEINYYELPKGVTSYKMRLIDVQ